jgi:hypothetical protein
MEMMGYFTVLMAIFAMVALGEIFKLKKEVRKLNKIVEHLLKAVNSDSADN